MYLFFFYYEHSLFTFYTSFWVAHLLSFLLLFYLCFAVFLFLHNSHWAIPILSTCISSWCFCLTSYIHYAIPRHCCLFFISLRISSVMSHFISFLLFFFCLILFFFSFLFFLISFATTFLKVFHFESLTSSKFLYLFITASAYICLQTESSWSRFYFSLDIALDFFNFYNWSVSFTYEW